MVKQHLRKLSSGLWHLQQSGRFCDTVVIVSGNVEVQAHAAVLAATSDQLGSVLQQNQSDNTLSRGTSQYRLDVAEYDKSLVTALLEFIYTGEIIALTSLNCSSRDELVGLCTKFGINIGDNSADNSLTLHLKSITDCHLMESSDTSHCAGATAESQESEVAKTDELCCSSVDVTQLTPECTNTSASDQKQQSRATDSMLKSDDGESLRRSHRCGVCSRRCSTSAALKRHEQIHAKGSSRSTVPSPSCRTCGKKYRHMSYLRCHERLHDGSDRPFICDICGKGFVGSSGLTTHRRTHTGDRPYACSICDKRFFQLCAVREHEKIHNGIKIFVCDVCGKRFMTRAQLYNHSRTHGGEKSFRCEVCQKRFYTNGDLVKHARIHADRRPFVCDVCGKGFKYSSNLHGHSRIHTGSRPFPCQTCGKAFTYSSHLSRHVKMHTRSNVVLDDAETPTPVKEEPSTPSTVKQSTDSIVRVPETTPSAILIVQPELLLGAPQVATNILPGLTIGPFTAQ